MSTKIETFLNFFMKLSEKLKLLLKQYGLSVLSFSKTQKVSHTAVAKWLKGEANPSPGKLLEIAKYFNIDIETLTNESIDISTKTTQGVSQSDEKFEDDFKKLLGLRNEIKQAFDEMSQLFDKRLSNIETILNSKKFNK